MEYMSIAEQIARDKRDEAAEAAEEEEAHAADEERHAQEMWYEQQELRELDGITYL